MRALAILLLLAGLVLTFTLGVPGYVVGPALFIAGGLMFRKELARRKAAAAGTAPAAPVAPAAPKRPFWQRAAIGLGCFACIAVVIVAFVFRVTGGLVDAADAFFAALKAKDVATARSYLAEDFRASTSDAELQSYFNRSALAHYASSSWSSRSVHNDRGELEGSITTDSGGVVPLKMSFIRENDRWKIYALRKPDSGLLVESERPSPPNSGEQLRLVKATMHSFADAIAHRDFSDFHHSIAGLWQRQISKDQLADGFKSFVATGADFHILDNVQPTIREAKVGDDGELVVAGLFPLTPNPLEFQQTYVYEGVDWKLIGLKLHIGSPK